MSTSKLSSLPSANELDTEFVSELNRLSIQERDEVTYDVHGVSRSCLDEEPEFVSRSMSSLKSELEKIPASQKRAYLMALSQNREYVLGARFLIMFLRAALFNPKAAAIRMTSFFEEKLKLFGKEKLGRHIRVDDLDENDICVLESGYAQILNARDRAGRAVFALIPTIRCQFRTEQSRLRVMYMVLMFALRDEDTQKNGMVGIIYNVGFNQAQHQRSAVMTNTELVSSLPLRFTALHYCYDDEKQRVLFSVAMFFLRRNERLRCRFHFGSDMEAVYTLMTFGIPNDVLPMCTNGTVRLQGHKDYVRRMRKTDDCQDDDTNRAVVPGKFDVLLGRGKPLQKYSGNLNYHYIVEGYHERYETAAKGDKADLAMEIVKKINSQGGRFLKQDEVGWTLISDDAAKSKVSHTFRNHRIAARTALKKAAAAVTDEECSSNSNGINKGTREKSRSPVDKKKRKVYAT